MMRIKCLQSCLDIRMQLVSTGCAVIKLMYDSMILSNVFYKAAENTETTQLMVGKLPAPKPKQTSISMLCSEFGRWKVCVNFSPNLKTLQL